MAGGVQFKVVVRDRAGAYVTNTVRGQRASCTHSAREAVEVLARKLVVAGHIGACRIGPAPADGEARPGESHWLIEG